jgi:hypothetical protein
VDLVVSTPEEFGWQPEIVGTIEYPAVKEEGSCMPDPEKVAALVSEWVAKAENDLQTAAHTLRLGKDCSSILVRSGAKLEA